MSGCYCKFIIFNVSVVKIVFIGVVFGGGGIVMVV